MVAGTVAVTTTRDVSKPPITSGWQRCSHCGGHGWITRVRLLRGTHMADAWQCENCRYDWPVERSETTETETETV